MGRKMMTYTLKTPAVALAIIAATSAPTYAELSKVALEAFDFNKNGKFDAGAELTSLEAANLSLEQRTTVQTLKGSPGALIKVSDIVNAVTNPLCKGESRLLLQDDVAGITLTNEKAIAATKKGAVFSYTDDRQNDKTSWKAAGALVWQPKQSPCLARDAAVRPEPGEAVWEAFAYGFYLKFDGEGTSEDDDKSDVRVGALAEFLLNDGFVESQVFNVNTYFRTDFQGEAEIYGVDASYTPLWVSSSAIQPSLKFNANYETVQQGGNSGLEDGAEKGWVGATLGLKTKIAPGETQLTLGVAYSMHYDLLNEETANLATADLTMPLDEKGFANLVLSYQTGTAYTSLTELDQTTVALSFKF